MPKELIRNEEHTLISLDLVSLFTNVPLLKTANIIIDRVDNQNLIKTTLSKKEAAARHLSENLLYV